jgi:hypothetical protein
MNIKEIEDLFNEENLEKSKNRKGKQNYVNGK